MFSMSEKKLDEELDEFDEEELDEDDEFEEV